jgi:lipoprotein-anchoring transpeptidase ErfK/SrfK
MGMRVRRSRILGLIVLGAAAIPATALAQAPPATTPAAPLAPGVIAPGVSIAGVPVGGMSEAAARAAVIDAVVLPRRAKLLVTFRKKRLVSNPVRAGYVADVRYALQGAMLFGRSRPVPATGFDVPLRQKVNVKRLRAQIASRAKKYDPAARDAFLSFKGVRPVPHKAVFGVEINVPKATRDIARAIVSRDRPIYALASRRVRPDVTSPGAAVIIQRDKFRLTWWRAGKTITFPVAVGQPAYPTPTGNFRIVMKQRNPTWFPPDSPWAAGLGPVPPGVSNPLGTRWMGTSAPGIGIHGTPVPSSVGTRASHGCVRMYIHDAERLYQLVDIGTPVIIR